MDTIYDNLSAYRAAGVYPFHMPGHKQNRAYLDAGLLDCDITELPGTDNLHQPTGIILHAQQRAARIFGADQSFFLVNGATGGLAAAILATVREGETVLVDRNCHRSVYGALTLSGAQPVYIPSVSTPYGIAGAVAPDCVSALLAAHSAAAAVIVTSPTYEGVVSDIAAIAEIVHQKNKILIVDEAHGAHFAFAPYFPKSAVACGADIVVQSLHKTLPMLTQTAVLHTAGRRVPIRRLQSVLSMIQTSSPSYMMLAQADRWLARLSNDHAAMDAYVRRLVDFRAAAAALPCLKLIGKALLGGDAFDFDRGKLAFYVDADNRNGAAVERTLRLKHGVQIEMSGARHIVAMSSPADTDEGFARLLNGLDAIAATLSPGEKPPLAAPPAAIPRQILSPRAAFLRAGRPAEETVVALRDSVGACSAAFVIPYPPGVPCLVPGEEITQEIVTRIEFCLANQIPVVGLAGGEKRLAQIFRNA